MSACALFLVACVLSLSLKPGTAHAFYVGEDWYPDSLVGYTVTLNATLTAPPTQICNQWWVLDITTISAAASPSQVIANSVYFFCENNQTVQSGNPWYWYSSCAKSTNSAGSLPGIDYFARFGYDGRVNGWWGLKSGVTRPTINFYGTYQDASAAGYAVTNHDFIIWIVNNSDFRSRYSVETWTTPTVVQDGQSFGWAGPSDNVSSTLVVTNTTTNTEVATFTGSQANAGSLVVSQSGTYRFVWSYSIGGLSRSSSWTSTPVSVTPVPGPSDGISVVSVEWTLTDTTLGLVTLTVHTSGPVGYVQLWMQMTDGSFALLPLQTFTEVSSGVWVCEFAVQTDGVYMIKYSSDNISWQEYYLGSAPNGSWSFAEHIKNLVEYVASFISHVGDLFAWLPVELRAFIISIIILMVVLGLFGWLKS